MTGRPTFAERRKALRAINRLGASLNIGLASADRMAGFQGFDVLAPTIVPAGNRKARGNTAALLFCHGCGRNTRHKHRDVCPDCEAKAP